jgi:hypothetical protein
VAFAADPYRRELFGADVRARQRPARRLDRHRDRVFIGPRHALGIDRHTTLPIGPHPRDLARGDAVARDVDSIANDTDWFFWLHHVFRTPERVVGCRVAMPDDTLSQF